MFLVFVKSFFFRQQNVEWMKHKRCDGFDQRVYIRSLQKNVKWSWYKELLKNSIEEKINEKSTVGQRGEKKLGGKKRKKENEKIGKKIFGFKKKKNKNFYSIHIFFFQPDKFLRYTHSQMDPAFQGVGKAPGLAVWRMENFKPVRQDEVSNSEKKKMKKCVPKVTYE